MHYSEFFFGGAQQRSDKVEKFLKGSLDSTPSLHLQGKFKLLAVKFD